MDINRWKLTDRNQPMEINRWKLTDRIIIIIISKREEVTTYYSAPKMWANILLKRINC